MHQERYLDYLSTYEGWGYTSVPIMTIESPESGTQATGVAIMTSRSGVPNQSVDRILLINPGTGYTTPPTVVFTPTSQTSSVATAVISDAVLGPYRNYYWWIRIYIHTYSWYYICVHTTVK